MKRSIAYSRLHYESRLNPLYVREVFSVFMTQFISHYCQVSLANFELIKSYGSGMFECIAIIKKIFYHECKLIINFIEEIIYENCSRESRVWSATSSKLQIISVYVHRTFY